MAVGKANCGVCGNPLKYFSEAQQVTCDLCGAQEAGHNLCEDGHYVCDSCHRSNGVEFLLDFCRTSDSTGPIRIFIEVSNDRSIYPNGPEHHTLVGGSAHHRLCECRR